MLLQDLRLAVRLLVRAPGFTLAAVVTLMLGIGMTTAIFSAVDAVLLRPIPFPEPERLVMLWETDRDSGTSHEPGSWPDFVDFQQRSRHLERLGGMIADEATLTPDRGEPVRVAGVFVTHELLPMLGVTPIVGRSITGEDDRLGGPAVALISERLWEQMFARDASALGRSIRLDDRPHTIVGVVPGGADFGILQILSAADYSRGFADRDPRTTVDVWLPLQADPAELVRDTHPLLMVGSLRSGATVAAAQEELSAIAADLERTHRSNEARGVRVELMSDVVFGPSRPALIVLIGAVSVVLLLACVNVANLLLVRGTRRRREVAIRSALGAGPGRLTRQFVTENLLLTLFSAAVGVLVAFGALRALIAFAPATVPRLASAGIDARVLSVALAISIVVGLVFGLLPVAQARRSDLQGALNAEDARGATDGRQARVVRSALVVAQVALAVVLVAGAGLLIRSFWHLQQVDPGFDPDGVLKVEFQLPSSRYPFDFKEWPDIKAIHRFNDALLARVSALPGVEAAALAGSHPLSAGFTNSFVIVGREEESKGFPELSMRAVTPGYFSAVRLRLSKGRLLATRDGTKSEPVVLVNEAAATRFFSDDDPLGQQIAFWGVRWTIVGVVANERFHGLTNDVPIAAYMPLAQAPSRGGQSLLVRTAGDPGALAGAVRGAIREIDPALAVYGVEPLTATLADSFGTRRFVMLLLMLFAALAMLLAAVGVHGVLSYTVSQRTREIGVRMAMGASPRSVVRLVLGEGAKLIVLGLGTGLVLGVAFTRALGGLLYGVTSTDPLTFLAVGVLLAVVAGVSSYIPARRAMRVDPIVALRE